MLESVFLTCNKEYLLEWYLGFIKTVQKTSMSWRKSSIKNKIKKRLSSAIEGDSISLVSKVFLLLLLVLFLLLLLLVLLLKSGATKSINCFILFYCYTYGLLCVVAPALTLNKRIKILRDFAISRVQYERTSFIIFHNSVRYYIHCAWAIPRLKTDRMRLARNCMVRKNCEKKSSRNFN